VKHFAVFEQPRRGGNRWTQDFIKELRLLFSLPEREGKGEVKRAADIKS